MQAKRKAFKRAGLHKLECECGGSVYSTVAALEEYGLPCCGCGGRLVPTELELAMLLELEDAPVVREWQRAVSSVMHGQAAHGIRGRQLKPAELVAAERVEAARREQARSNRLGALAPAPEPMPF